MNYKESLEYLNSLIPFELKPGQTLRLERIETLLDLIGNPQNSLLSIHIGGTAGKSSTAHITEAILRQAGYKTGLHVSPHLERLNERLQVNGQEISNKDFAGLVSWIKPFINKTATKSKLGAPTYFEVLVTLAFEHFHRNKIDIAIIEVGLGGRLDATNILNPPVSVITNVDLDHTRVLGSRLEEIAKEKAGIIKKGAGVITATHTESALNVIKKECESKNCQLIIVGQDIAYNIHKTGLRGSTFDIKTPKSTYKNLWIDISGSHQAENACLALGAIEFLENKNLLTKGEVGNASIRKALLNLHVPGRMEILEKNGYKLILDGAHSPIKMKMLAQSLREIFPNKKLVFVIGIKKNKDYKNILKEIVFQAKKIIFTNFSRKTDLENTVGTTPEELMRTTLSLNSPAEIEMANSPQEAAERALTESDPDDIICVTGSLYLVGEVRSKLTQNNNHN